MIDHVNTLRRCSQAHQDLTFAWWDGSHIIDIDLPDDNPFDSDYAPSDSDSTGNVDDDLSFVSDSDLTATGVEEMNNNDDDHNNDDNNANDPNAHEHDNPEEQEIQQQEEVDPEEQAAGEQEEEEIDENNMQHENEHKECKEELNNNNKEELNGNNKDLRAMTGVEGKLAGVAQIIGVEPEIDEDSEDEEDEVGAYMDWKYGPWMHSHDLQPRKPCNYSHLHSNLEHIMLTQYNFKKGLKLFGEASANAVITEMQ